MPHSKRRRTAAGPLSVLGQDVTAWSQPKRARAGLGRSYQRNTIYSGFSVLENCRLAAQASTQKPWHWWQPASGCVASNTAARAAAGRAGRFRHDRLRVDSARSFVDAHHRAQRVLLHESAPGQKRQAEDLKITRWQQVRASPP